MKKFLLLLALLSSCTYVENIESSIFSSENTISVEEELIQTDEMFMIKRTYNTGVQSFVEDDGYFIFDYEDPTDLEDGVSQYYAYFRYIRYTDQDGKLYDIGYSQSGSYFELEFLHAITEFYFNSEINDYVNNNMTYQVDLESTFEGTLENYLDFITTQVVYQENANMDVELFIDKFYTIFDPVLNISWSF